VRWLLAVRLDLAREILETAGTPIERVVELASLAHR
jgi:transcriptional regulator GlxA family with amidase domain